MTTHRWRRRGRDGRSNSLLRLPARPSLCSARGGRGAPFGAPLRLLKPFADHLHRKEPVGCHVVGRAAGDPPHRAHVNLLLLQLIVLLLVLLPFRGARGVRVARVARGDGRRCDLPGHLGEQRLVLADVELEHVLGLGVLEVIVVREAVECVLEVDDASVGGDFDLEAARDRFARRIARPLHAQRRRERNEQVLELIGPDVVVRVRV